MVLKFGSMYCNILEPSGILEKVSKEHAWVPKYIVLLSSPSPYLTFLQGVIWWLARGAGHQVLLLRDPGGDVEPLEDLDDEAPVDDHGDDDDGEGGAEDWPMRGEYG